MVLILAGWAIYYVATLLNLLHGSSRSEVFDLVSLLGLFVGCLVVLSAVRGARSSNAVAGRASRAIRIGCRLGLAGLLLLLVALNLRLYVYMWRPLVPEKPQLLEPNAYDELVRIGTDLRVASLTAAERQDLMHRARAAMLRPCQFPLHFDSWDSDMSGAIAIRDLEFSLQSESAAALSNGQYGLGIDYAVDCMRLAQKAAHKGTMFHRELGNHFDQTEIERLRKLRRSLDAVQCQEILNELIDLDADREPLESVVHRTERWQLQVLDWDDWLQTYDLLSGNPSTLLSPRRRDRQSSSDNWRDAKLRLFLVELALQAFRETTKRDPKSLAELVPVYLPEVPLDPYDGIPIRYRRTQAGYDCYSVGLDGKDDGGKRTTPGRLYFGGDLFLDAEDF